MRDGAHNHPLEGVAAHGAGILYARAGPKCRSREADAYCSVLWVSLMAEPGTEM